MSISHSASDENRPSHQTNPSDSALVSMQGAKVILNRVPMPEPKRPLRESNRLSHNQNITTDRVQNIRSSISTLLLSPPIQFQNGPVIEETSPHRMIESISQVIFASNAFDSNIFACIQFWFFDVNKKHQLFFGRLYQPLNRRPVHRIWQSPGIHWRKSAKAKR